jgi:hypothetical protein
LPKGDFAVVFEKDGYGAVERARTVAEDSLDFYVKMAEGELKEEPTGRNVCEDVDYECYVLTIYFLDANENSGMAEKSESYPIKAGTVFGDPMEWIAKYAPEMADVFDSLGGIKQIEYFGSWYYRGTNEKVDWEAPINRDMEVEFRLLGGSMGNDDLQGLFDMMSN